MRTLFQDLSRFPAWTVVRVSKSTIPHLETEIHHIQSGGVIITVSLDMSRHADRRCVVTASASPASPLRLRLGGILNDSEDLMCHWTWRTVRLAHNSPHSDWVVGEVAVLLENVPPDSEAERQLLLQLAKTEALLVCAKVEHVLSELHFTAAVSVLQPGGSPVAG